MLRRWANRRVSESFASMKDIGQLVEVFGPREGIRLHRRLRTASRLVDVRFPWGTLHLPVEGSTRYHLAQSLQKMDRLAGCILPSDRIVMDVGAHVGIFAAMVANRAPWTRLVLLEPDPRWKDVIGLNLSHHDDWQLHELAAADAPREASLFRAEASSQTSSLLAESVALQGAITDALPVAVTTLDQLCEQSGIGRVDVVKIDVQGAESLVIAGASSVLSSARAVIVEVSFADPDPCGVVATLAAEFGPPVAINSVHMGADLLFERRPRGPAG